MPCPPEQCSRNSRFDKTSSTYRESNSTDAKRYDTLYGVDPVSAQLLDRSIARSWPLSSWHISISTNNYRLPWYPYLETTIESSSAMNKKQDNQSFFNVLYGRTWRYGEYVVTMSTQTSSTGTSSEKEFVQYINIAEFEPFSNFIPISADTVLPTFSTDTDSALSGIVPIPSIPNAFDTDESNVCFNFISGYAPNLTVYFQDTSEAHTFPIKKYEWNFGDTYNEGSEDLTDTYSNYYTVSDVTILNGSFESPCWVTDKQNHIGKHTYIMPGTYDVTLTVTASTTNTTDVCAKNIGDFDEQRFNIYVEEIPPVCTGSIQGSYSPYSGYTSAASGLSGLSPLTTYFLASDIVAGSFPICRMDWDFGDGTTQIITRLPLTEVTDQGLAVRHVYTFDDSKNDPRNVVVPHIYETDLETPQSYSISVSAYACNTNTMITCSAENLVSPFMKESVLVSDTKRLIGSRFDEQGDVVYVLEGQNENTTYTILLTGETA